MKVLRGFRRWAKGEAVLIIALVLALASMFFVPPSREYFDYLNLQVLCLLFSLMAVVSGLESCGLFSFLAGKLIGGEKRFRTLSIVLVLMPFFFSMVVTNDVALITFVPFAVLVLGLIDHSPYLGYVVVLQTLAANLGSALTPFGSPQNLFLYSRYGMGVWEIVGTMLPYVLTSLLALTAAAAAVKNRAVSVKIAPGAGIGDRRKLALFAGLFVLCLLAVFRVLHYGILTAVVAAALLLFSRPTLKKVDYALLATFVCFFVFSGNMGRIPAVSAWIGGFMEQSVVLSAAAVSQVISNVPAAVLLSQFTQDGAGLLIGANLGGLGTLIASLASLISFRFYIKTPDAKPGRYLILFTAANALGLALLLGVHCLRTGGL
ncbi:SLC13 family permease [Gehongia tenuis]|uniref:Citrate transporter n=1 Tax=Gehongia tenuis TaxID=2763655 RepID=A0A926D310_9FIRM|nr:SLC13 family permease [Gehongia tenuis]MBC8530828.1 citrate transporter [Gehongia tenuis]